MESVWEASWEPIQIYYDEVLKIMEKFLFAVVSIVQSSKKYYDKVDQGKFCELKGTNGGLARKGNFPPSNRFSLEVRHNKS